MQFKEVSIFIFCSGAVHGGIFAWLVLLLGLPGIFSGSVIGKLGDRYGRGYVVPAGFLWVAGCAFLRVFPTPRFVAALVITALSLGFDARHPLMSSITTLLANSLVSLEPISSPPTKGGGTSLYRTGRRSCHLFLVLNHRNFSWT